MTKRIFGISNKIWWIVLIWVTVLLGVLLRTIRADEYPVSQNDDSLFYAWVGNSVWDDFIRPTSLSIFEDSETLFWRSQYKDFDPRDRFGFRMSEPWFDSPILGSIIVSLPARLMGYTGFSQYPHMLVRLPAILASGMTLVLTYLLGKELFGKREGFWGLLMLSVWPLAAFSQRQSYLENFITPLLLLGLLGVLRLKKKRKNWSLIICLVALVSGWIKFAGFFVPAILAYFLGLKKEWKVFWKVIGFFGLSLTLYLLYGHIVGGEAFWQTIGSQAGRGSYLLSWFRVLEEPGIYGMIKDSWWYLGWFGLFWLANTNQKGKFLLTSVVLWMVVVFLTSGRNNTSPWYWYPIYPFLALAMGKLTHSLYTNLSFVKLAVFLFLGLGHFELAGYEFSSNMLRILAVMILGFGYLYEARLVGWKKLSKKLVVILVSLMVISGALATMKYPETVCGDGGCLSPTKVWIEE